MENQNEKFDLGYDKEEFLKILDQIEDMRVYAEDDAGRVGLYRECPFGFGCGRLPQKSTDGTQEIDLDKLTELIDTHMEQGFNYFEASGIDADAISETALRKTLTDIYLRDIIEVGSDGTLRKATNTEEVKAILQGSLDRLGVEYLDYYAVSIGTADLRHLRESGIFDTLSAWKPDGLVRYLGLIADGSAEDLESVLSAAGDLFDYVRMELNYLDMDTDPEMRSRLSVAERYQKPVCACGTLKGGELIRLPEEAKALLKAYDGTASIASWGLRFAAGQTGVFRVICNMETWDQVIADCETFIELTAFNQEESEMIGKVTEILKK